MKTETTTETNAGTIYWPDALLVLLVLTMVVLGLVVVVVWRP